MGKAFFFSFFFKRASGRLFLPELWHRAKYWQSRTQQTMDLHTYLRNFPDAQGRFGEYGGVYLPDELVPAFEEITEAYQTIAHSAQFINELRRIRKQFQGRPTPVYHCERLSRHLGTSQIYLKREDLNHEGLVPWEYIYIYIST